MGASASFKGIFGFAAMAGLSLVIPAAAWAADPVAACAALRPSQNFSDTAQHLARIVDAPTNILSAQIVGAERDLPEHCRVEGEIAPTIGFVMKLPTQDWNGKVLMGGCGGPCGILSEPRLEAPLVRHYAVITTDMGHRGAGWAFGYQNLQGLIDFGSRSTHLTAVVAKELAALYYDHAAKQTYFDGCSTGGRQAMVEAQRFPDDFTGIIGGAPPYSQIGDTPYFLSWGARANIDSTGKPILDAAKLPLIHQAVMKACATKSDAALGILLNPQACRWDPKALLCKSGGDPSQCLTPAEAEVVQKIYDGATTSKGRKLYFGMARGSENTWAPSFVNSDGKPGNYLSGFGGAGNSMMTYGAYFYSVGPTYKETDFDYDRDPARLGVMESLYDAQNPDLRGFKAAGGKLILYHGWDDNQIPPQATIDYYETATRTLGGPAATRDFFRMFLLPGVGHCRGGDGGSDVDWLTALERWVENGVAPDEVIAYHVKTRPGELPSAATRFPLPAGSYDRARPVFPYPAVARWKGTGDPMKPENWVKGSPN